jgi:hypothetical protein
MSILTLVLPSVAKGRLVYFLSADAATVPPWAARLPHDRTRAAIRDTKITHITLFIIFLH